jgi:hypothetical protein
MTPYGRPYREFDTDKLNRAGTVVKIAWASERWKGGMFLIGDVNLNGGVCDDCQAFTWDQIVEAYDDALVERIAAVKVRTGA